MSGINTASSRATGSGASISSSRARMAASCRATASRAASCSCAAPRSRLGISTTRKRPPPRSPTAGSPPAMSPRPEPPAVWRGAIRARDASRCGSSGPLRGLRIVEVAGIGPGPFAAMLLADMGADVVRIDRPGAAEPDQRDVTGRGRRTLVLDLKQQDGAETASQLLDAADALIEGFRPGVMERLGLGPDAVLARNPRLVYGRMTGWGQSGPLAQAAGHDINYIALTGVLDAIGRAGQKPTPPLNLVGDFGGGALYLALGIACGLLEAQRSGKGQLVDAAMADGAASLMTMFFGMRAGGQMSLERGTNILDSGAFFYEAYECADVRH